MKWRGRRASTQVRDMRGQSAGRGLGGGLGGLLFVVMRRFGIKGMILLAVIGFVAWQAGLVDPSMLVDQRSPDGAATIEVSPEEEERFAFVQVVLADTEDIWTSEFERRGATYELPKLVVFRGRVQTACGAGDASMGPFYCPGDRTVYIDLSFYDELARTFQSPGDFAQAYVIAHEVGHHVQNLLGTSEKVAAMRGRPEYNEYSVRLELQADFYAGVWANRSQQYLEPGDIEEAMRAANAIGDDAIQLKMQGKVVPHAFTHGTSEQRMRWFMKGFTTGTIEEGDTFALPYEAL